MNDRELLELAAKAAGIGPLDFDYAIREGHGFYMGPRLPMPQGILMAAMHTYWDPLTDDGDALRLAVKLSLLVLPYPDDNAVRVTRLDQTDTIVSFGTPAEPYAATRRAIVLAAAEIRRST